MWTWIYHFCIPVGGSLDSRHCQMTRGFANSGLEISLFLLRSTTRRMLGTRRNRAGLFFHHSWGSMRAGSNFVVRHWK